MLCFVSTCEFPHADANSPNIFEMNLLHAFSSHHMPSKVFFLGTAPVNYMQVPGGFYFIADHRTSRGNVLVFAPIAPHSLSPVLSCVTLILLFSEFSHISIFVLLCSCTLAQLRCKQARSLFGLSTTSYHSDYTFPPVLSSTLGHIVPTNKPIIELF